MPNVSSRVNRGPAAAPANRAAILGAARRLLARDGLGVPLSAIAREASVSQGVMYRHFDSLLDLAIAVFEDNLAELASIAATPGPEAFGRLWRAILEQTVRESAFVEVMIESRRNKPDYDGDARVRALLADTLPRAQEAGQVPAEVTVAGVMLAWRMAFGVVATAEPGAAWDDLDRAGLLTWP